MGTRIVQAIRQLITGRDNQTHDLGRYSWAISTAAVLAHDACQLHAGAAVSVRDLAIALAAVAAAHGVALGLKASTEPAPAKPEEAP